jgi:hypothetical protein
MSTSFITTFSVVWAYAGAKIPAKSSIENTKGTLRFIAIPDLIA